MAKNKIAIFVEGLTELELTKTLLHGLCGKRGLALEVRRQFSGKLLLVSNDSPCDPHASVLLVNCSTDSQVKSQIRDQYTTLVAAGYNHIIGLKDVYPHPSAELPKVQHALSLGLPTGNIPVQMHLAILEVESWFLDEHTHFERIEPTLTIANIAASGFDLLANPGLTWPHPSQTLDAIYKIAGIGRHALHRAV